MTKDTLIEANKIEEELSELNRFLTPAQKVWTGKMTLKHIISNALGFYDKQFFEMDTEIKNKVLQVLLDYKEELENKIKEL